MSENLLQTLQSLVQDVIAPDVRELKVRLASLEKQIDVRFEAVNDKFAAVDGKFAAVDGKFAAMNEKMDVQFGAVNDKFAAVDGKFAAMSEKMDVQFRAIMAAIGESRAQSELTTLKLLSALSERVAVLESQRPAHN
jgi:hypothetical protein